MKLFLYYDYCSIIIQASGAEVISIYLHISKILHLSNIPSASKGGSTQVLHSSIIIISYTTISTVSFSTTQIEEDAKTQDLIHLRSGTCIFSSIWIYT